MMNCRSPLFTFIYCEEKVNYDEAISDLIELKQVMKKLFKIEDNFEFDYLETNNDRLRISSFEDFKNVVDYHLNAKRSDRICINVKSFKAIKESFLVDFSRLPLQQSTLIEYNNKFEQNKIEDQNEALKSLSDLKKEVELIKLKMLSKEEMLEIFKRNEELSFKTFNDKIEQIMNLNNVNKVNSHKNEKFISCNQIILELIPKPEEDLQNENVINNNNQLPVRSNICSLCLIDIPKFSCTICQNYLLCNKCFIRNNHANHPLLTIVADTAKHFSKENISMMNFAASESLNKPQQLNLIYNKKFYSDRANHVQISITSYDEANLNLKLQRSEAMEIPIDITNYSSVAVEKEELLLTGRNNSIVQVENKVINEKIKKQGKINTIMKITSPDEKGCFEFEIVVLHLYRKVEHKPLKILIEVID